MLYATTGQVNILRVPISSAPESEGVAWAVTLSPRSAYRNHTRTVGTDITDGRVYREFELELARSEAAEDIGGGVAWLVPGWQYDLVLRADGVEYWRDILVVVAASEEPAPVPVAPTPQTSVGCATLAFTVGAAPSGYEVQWSEDGFATVAGTGVAYSRLFGTVGNITISIRHIDVFSNVSEVVQTTATVTMPAAPAAPAAQSRVGCGALTFSVDTPPAGFTAQWSRDNFATIAATGATYDSLYNTIGQTNVAVRYIDACGNSTSTSSTTVTIALASEPTGGILPPVVPQGVASTLAFSGSIPAGFTLEWSLDNFATVAGTGTSFTSIFLLSSSPYTISLRYVDACGNAGAIAQVPLEVFNFGNALFFDSVNDVWHAVHNAFTDIGGGDFAINVWLKQGTSLTNARIVHKYDNTTGSLAGWQLVTHIVGANSPPSKILSLQDGKILLGGAFTIYNERTCGRIALLNPDASANNSFNTEIGANNNLLDFDVQGDGKVLIAGSFTTYNSTARNRIARLNADGSLDTTFNIGTGFGSQVESLKLQADGKVIAAGGFTTYNSTARNRIARLNADGSLDTTFNIGTGANLTINTIAIQPDGKVLIGGFFTTYNSTARNRIARLNADGSLDTTFNIGTGANGSVFDVSIQTDGKVLIAGDFSTYNGVSANRIARLNANGSLDTTFNIGTGANNSVFDVSIQTDGKVLIAGSFTTYNGVSANRIARLNANGSLDTTFNIGTGANGSVIDVSIQTDGKVLIAGSFTTYNGVSANRIARLNADGSLDTTFNDNAGLSFIFADSSNTFSAINIGGPPITSNQWNMLTISRAAGVLSLYVNGGKLRPDVPLVMSMATTQPLLLGGNVSPTPIAVLNGQLNEYTHYNRGLTSAEITEMYKFGLGMKPWGSLLAGLRVRYSFDALASTAYPSPTIADQSGNGNTLTGFNIASNPLVAH